MSKTEAKARLSDLILTALELSLAQEDLATSEHLVAALEQAMTRKAGGGEFIERRNYSLEMESAMKTLSALKAANR